MGKVVNMFKIRYSWGKTGNDLLAKDSSGKWIRFPYTYNIGTSGTFNFADINASAKTWEGMHYTSISSPDVSWEISTKQDLGIDFSFFNDKLTGAVDYFFERREGIYKQRNSIPYEVGIEYVPSANVGIVEAKGFDGNFALKQRIGKIDFTLRGNITYSKNEIIEYDEENTIYEYKLYKGDRVNQAKGYLALGLFKDYDDIRNSPKQSGDIMPGDIKYADINGDGLINSGDIVNIGSTTKPNLVYGFGVSANMERTGCQCTLPRCR